MAQTRRQWCGGSVTVAHIGGALGRRPDVRRGRGMMSVGPTPAVAAAFISSVVCHAICLYFTDFIVLDTRNSSYFKPHHTPTTMSHLVALGRGKLYEARGCLVSDAPPKSWADHRSRRGSVPPSRLCLLLPTGTSPQRGKN